MPRMPRPGGSSGGGGYNPSGPSWTPTPSYGSASENIKLKTLEEKLRDDLAPQNMELLKEVEALPEESCLYVYDKKQEKLKRISANNLGEIIIEQTDEKIDTHLVDYNNPHKVTKEQLGIKYDLLFGIKDEDKTESFKTYHNFPNVGNENTLYVAVDENKIYRYDGDHYVAMKADTPEIKIEVIDGGKAPDDYKENNNKKEKN